MGCAAQKELQTLGHGGTPGQPNSTDWRPKQSKEAGATNHDCMEGQSGGEVVGEDKNEGIMIDMEPGQLGRTKSNCRYTSLQDITKTEVSLNELIPCSLDTCLLSNCFVLDILVFTFQNKKTPVPLIERRSPALSSVPQGTLF